MALVSIISTKSFGIPLLMIASEGNSSHLAASSNRRPHDGSWSFAGLEGSSDPRKIRRTSEMSDVSSRTQTTVDLDQADLALEKHGIKLGSTRDGIMKKMLERSRLHEEKLKRERADAALARQLASQHDGPSASSSSSTPFARSEPPRQQSYFGFDGQIQKPVRSPSPPRFGESSSAPSFKPDPAGARVSTPYQFNAAALQQNYRQAAKQESDSSDLEEITPQRFAAAAANSSPRLRKEPTLTQLEMQKQLLAQQDARREAARQLARQQAAQQALQQAARTVGTISFPGYNPMGGSSVYGGGPPPGPYTVNNIPMYGDGFQSTARPRMPGSFPGVDMNELLDVVGSQRGPRPPPAFQFPTYDSDDDSFPRRGGGFTPGGMSNEEVEEMMKAVQADKHFPKDKRSQTPHGFAIELYEHQKIGLTWLMLQEENKACKGGILADDMGLGKTIEAMSLMVARPSQDKSRKTTLIVAPVALMKQWAKEIDTKLKRGHKLKVFVYHGQKTKKATFAQLSTYDVVLTTFGTLANEYTRKLKWIERKTADPSATQRPSDVLTLIDDKSKWYRIIIDEAQCIKNKSTKAAGGAASLNALHRWCLSGTPMMNNIGELHALISFLKIPPYNDAEKFNREIKRPLASNYGPGKARAMQAVQATLKVIMLRRTKKSEVDGKPIIENLPERSTDIVHAEFDEDQEAFYRAIETETQLQVNRYLEQGKIGRNYSYILVRLLRLRQACCHPQLIHDFAEDGAVTNMSNEDMEELARQFEDKVVLRIKEADGAFECPICYDATEAPTLLFSCGHDVCGECFTKLVDPSNGLAAGNETGAANAKCPECRGAIDPKRVVEWKAFVKVHMPEKLPEDERPQEEATDDSSDSDSDSEDDSDDDEADDNGDLRDFVVDDDEVEEDGDDQATASEAEEVLPSRKAKKTKKLYDDEETMSEAEDKAEAEVGEASTTKKSKARKIVRDDDETASEADDDDFDPVREAGSKQTSAKPTTKKSKGKGIAKATTKPKAKATKRKKGKGKKKEIKLADLKRESQKNAAAKKKYLKRLRKMWVPSAKTNRTLELLREIRDHGEGEKTIIFSQFTTLLDLMEVAIGNDFKYRRYDGSMRPVERDLAVEQFQAPDSDIEVLLVSLKAGNAGLNLTAANQVIILDPFWNPFIEEQAIDRAHRIGQTRPVKVHRVLVANTVEDRIVALQEKKRELINTALDEKAGEGLGRLGLAELRYLFGLSDGVPGGAAAAPGPVGAGNGTGA